MDAKEEIRLLKMQVKWEQENRDQIDAKIENLNLLRTRVSARLKKYEELLAAELSQVSA